MTGDGSAEGWGHWVDPLRTRCNEDLLRGSGDNWRYYILKYISAQYNS